MAEKKQHSTPLETTVTNTICEYLQYMGFFFYRNNTTPIFSRNNAGNMAFRSMPKYAKKGLPDLIMIHRGMYIGIEVKREGVNKLRPEQEITGAEIKGAGGLYFVVHNLEELKNNLINSRIFQGKNEEN